MAQTLVLVTMSLRLKEAFAQKALEYWRDHPQARYLGGKGLVGRGVVDRRLSTVERGLLALV